MKHWGTTLKTLHRRDGGRELGPRVKDDGANRPSSDHRIAYLLSRYPAVSHTFLLEEVLGLRLRGIHIETASINPPDRTFEDLPLREAEEAKKTHYVQGGSRLRAAWTLIWIALRQPAVVHRGVKMILSIRDLTLRHRLYWFFYLAEALLVGHWMRKRGLKHLHVHFGGPVASVGLLASAAFKLPFSLTIHGPEELLDTSSNHLREKVEQASFIFCISDFCRSQLYLLMTQEHWRKCHVLRLGANPATLSKTHHCKIRDGAPLQVVCIGRLVAAKGHRTLLQALLLLRDRAITMQLTLIGGGPEMRSLQDFVHTYSLSDCVTFTQALSHNEALAYLRQADLFVLASFAEGIPVALMEAMALGIPCISTFVAGIPELIQDGVQGLLVPPGNPQAFADALYTLAKDDFRRLEMGEAARKQVVEQYNMPRNHEKLANTFKHLMAGHGRRAASEVQT